MKKLAVTALTLFLVLSQSQAKTRVEEKDLVSQKRFVLKTPMQMRSVVVRAIPKAQRRLLLATNVLSEDDSDDPPGPDELDLHQGYRRPELAKGPSTDVDHDDLSDHVKTRLLIARVRALQKYQEIWT